MFFDDSSMAIRFEHVTKEYRLFKNDRSRLAGILFGADVGDKMRASDDLSFDIYKGESVALVGSNGAGKSTILKMITGITEPTSGRILVNGRVSALLDLTAGFDAQLTGRENIILRGQIWGLSKERILQALPEIVDFSEIGVYIDQPLRTYSSGMKARLGFAFASSIDPDILIVDEALAVGDRSFSKKCTQRVKEIVSVSNTTVLFVTHSSRLARNFCERGIVLSRGKMLCDDYIDRAISFYEELE